MNKSALCCDQLEQLLSVMENIGCLSVGEGEISGSVEIDESGIWLSDGWNHIPKVEFNFCPYCGMNLRDKTTGKDVK